MNKKKRTIITVVVAVLVVMIAASGGYLLFKHLNTSNTKKKYSELASSYAQLTVASDEVVTDESGVPLKPNPVDFASLQAQNSEIYSWIKIPNTNVDYPVLRSETDDNFYIDHDYEKDYSFAGAIYSQFCNHRDYSDRVTVLYGHNMADNSMFASLHNFEDAGFFEENREMTIYTPDKQLDYDIVSAFVYDDRHIMNSFDFTKDDVYRDFLDSVMNPHSVSSNVRDGVTLDINDRIVILSTCLNYGDGRYLVVGKLTGETPLAP